MSVKFYTILTELGAAKLANATALGSTLEITHMAVGDGGGVTPTPTASQTALIHEQRRAPLNSLGVDPVNTNQIIAEQIIPEDVGGWYIREVGLFDKDGILIAVANCPDTYKPQLSEGSGRTQAVRMILIVSSTAAVTLKIDPSVVLATRKYVDDLSNAIEIRMSAALIAHQNSRNHPSATTTEKGFVKLSSAVNSTSTTDAATPSAVRLAYDLAVSKVSPETLQNKGFFHSQVNKQDVSQFTFNDFGRRVWIDNDSPSAFTLPDISNIEGSGQTITVWNVRDTNITISVGNSSNSISVPMSTVKTLTLRPTESVVLVVEQNKTWHATGDAVLRLTPSWSFNPAFNGGWQKLPSGLIIQWGGVSTISGDTTTMLPVTFPTAFLHAAVTMDYTPGSGAVTYIAACPSSRSTIISRTASPGLGGRYIAIGY
ncbi:phage tail protein [Limnobaculum zhutongyuii]|uniref:Phage tail protein n=1 Tax=Limnobaculum zhutongyuii TaxID=2498113 RepID=A0A411WMD6_9GAMM|nr:phage tail protein [Limnobaculum zhutongyuii]QBH97342.1 phage tail protein [Limnobaculum zhutongyuii]TQS90815.1 phage tail protein [Limnobaculum zhutongyuii]